MMNSQYYRRSQLEPNITQQTGQANFNGSKLASTLIPLHRLAEQRRIVAHVDQPHGALRQAGDQAARGAGGGGTGADVLCQAITATRPSRIAPAVERADDALVLSKDEELQAVPRSSQLPLDFAATSAGGLERSDSAQHTNGTLAQSTLGLLDTVPSEDSAYTAVRALLAERGC